MTQGGKAVTSGKMFENNVERILQGHGYVQVGQNLRRKQKLESILSSTNLPKRYATQVHVGDGIYGTDIYVDFYLICSASFNSGLIIQCQSQQTSGSVDEKLPYLNLNIQDCYPAPTVVLLDGGGMKAGAIDWLKAQVGVNPNLLAVHNLTDFVAWANNNL